MKTVEREDLLNEFVTLVKRYSKKFGTTNITRDWWRNQTKYSETKCNALFGTFSKMKEVAFDTADIKKRENTEIKVKGKSGKRTYFVTSVVEGAKLHSGFMDAIDTFCKTMEADRVLLWIRGVHPNETFTSEQFVGFGTDLVTEFIFNDKLQAKDFMLHPAQLLPLTGLGRFGNRDTSLIIASTKQHMTSVPRAKGNRPHTLWSTGTASIPSYSPTRSGALARQDNTIGGLVVEVEDNKRFYIRPVQYKDGGFIDLGIKYCSDGEVKMGIKAEVIVWGDLHATEEDDDAVCASIDQANKLQARAIMIHDVCSWNSVNHHDMNSCIIPAGIKPRTLQDDYKYTAYLLDNIIHRLDTADLFIVKSNHDLWVKKWVNNGNFLHDKNNSIVGAKAFIDFCSGIDPIETNVKQLMQYSDRCYFLKHEQSFKVAGYELGQHGENGANGSKGSIKGIGRAHDKIVVGHSHSPNIFYSAIQVGTNSKLQLPYAHGASSWMHANCVIYPNGTFQLLTFIDDKWHLTNN